MVNVRRGSARSGRVWFGWARSGMESQGQAGFGLARHGGVLKEFSVN